MQDDPLRRSLGYALARAFRTVNRHGGRAVQPFGLSSEQAHILLVLWMYGPMKVGALQRLLALSSPTLTGAIDRMAAGKLLKRKRDAEDGRAWVVEPMPFPAAKRKKIIDRLQGVEDEAFGMLRASERSTLRGLLEKVAAGT